MELENVVNLSLGALAIAAAALHSKLMTRSPNILSLSSPSSVLSKLSSPLTLPTSPSGLYLGSHLPAIFSEWIQSAHIFQVYKSAGQEDSSIALMFLFSSLTSALFGSLLDCLTSVYCQLSDEGLKFPSFAFLGSTSQRGHNGRTIHCARDTHHRGGLQLNKKHGNCQKPKFRPP